MSVYVREVACPFCGRLNDRHGEIDDPLAQPSKDDISICWGCLLIAVFDEDATGGQVLRRPTPDERRRLYTDPDVSRALAAMTHTSRPQDALNVTRRHAR